MKDLLRLSDRTILSDQQATEFLGKANGGKIARNTGPDPRLVFLERASARLFLVEAGEMTLDEAFEGLVASLQCSCSRELVQRWEQNYPPSAIKRRKTFR
jgi:hypothetical protein